MSRRALILAVVVLLIASSTLVLAPAAARGSPASVALRTLTPHPAVSSIQLYTSSGEYQNYNVTYFTTGNWYEYGSNTLYFAIRDTVDTSATFTVTDPNATRDGVGQPAFSATVTLNNTTHEYFSTETGKSFTFPADLKIGGGWNVSVTGTLGGNASYPIYVGTYYTNTGGSPNPGSVVLPGETITTAFQAVSDTNGAPVTTITNLSYSGYYYGANDNFTNLFSGSGIIPQPAAPLGSYTWTVPANATPNTYLYFEIWDSIYSGGQMAENESYYAYYLVGGVAIYTFGLESDNGFCPNDRSTYFASGSYIQGCAVVGATAFDEFTPVPNLPVTVGFWNGTTHVTPPGNVPTTLMSNATGTVAFAFWADAPQFSTYWSYPFYNAINLTVTDPAAKPVPNSTAFTVWSNVTFYLESGLGSVGVTVGLNQLSYFPGQVITATWALNSTLASVGSVQAVAWYLTGTNDWFLGEGPISSTASSGTVTVALPSGYIGEFTLRIYASNATASFEGEVSGAVLAPTLTLTPSSSTFTPGSTVTVQPLAWGDMAASDPMITYQVFAEYGQGWTGDGGGGLISSGTVTNGSSITINVPSVGAPSDYWVYAYLTSSAGTLASTDLEVVQAWGYNVLVGVTTQSNYADGSFQPGQTVTVSYQIAPYGNAPLPALYTFTVYLSETQIESSVSTTSSSGTFQFTIPSNWPSGQVFIEVELVGTYLYGNTCYGGYCYGESGITINAHPSALSMEVGAGSGLTVGWLILLIIIIVVAVVLVLLMRRKRSNPPMGGTPVTTPMTPPAPAPSTPGAAEWQEPTPASGGSQPPMPSPPPGAQ